jgi:hypothetical protein
LARPFLERIGGSSRMIGLGIIRELPAWIAFMEEQRSEKHDEP